MLRTCKGVRSRQIHGEVKVIGLPSAIPAAFGLPRDATGRPVRVGSLPAGTAVINAVAAQDLGAQRPAWQLAYMDVLDGDFLQGATFHLLSRARGYASDMTVQNNPASLICNEEG